MLTTRPLAHPVTPFADPLPIPARHVITEPTRLTIPIKPAYHRFHRELPPSKVWTYDGQLPGPSIEVPRGIPIEVMWENQLEGTLPVVVTTAPAYEVDGVPVQCLPGRSGGQPDRAAAALRGFSVVHLHGAVVQATNDGWTENLALPSQPKLDRYPNDQRAAALWYHDHVMGVTRLNVYAGLAGMWIIRDDVERRLGLPEGPPYELPILLADRNFDIADDGSLTGVLLHKNDPQVMECFGPLTTVNGVVWPVLDVEPATYRFRVLNASNARTYRLVLCRNGEPDLGRITQIGTDGGLLAAPACLPPQGLVLASAERADLLVDFSDLVPGSELTWWNTAAAPFDGTFAAPATAGVSDPDALLAYPEVLRFRVVEGRGRRYRVPQTLSTDIEPVARSSLAGCPRRAIALVEREAETEGEPSMLTLRELIEDPGAADPVVTVFEPGEGGPAAATRYRTGATRFEDGASFFPVLHHAELWRFINLTADTHPMHVHLEAFQILERHAARVEIPEGGVTATATSATVRIGERDLDDGIPHVVDDNERGLKDTVRVNANEVVDVVVRFDAFAGRYMYH
ncbi:MAG TPA: multicopper oxidase domain-containing protein, partial [Actinomycetota bacterium]